MTTKLIAKKKEQFLEPFQRNFAVYHLKFHPEARCDLPNGFTHHLTELNTSLIASLYS